MLGCQHRGSPLSGEPNPFTGSKRSRLFPMRILRNYGSFHSQSFIEYTVGFSKDYMTSDISTDQMLKMRKQQPSIKPDTEEL